MNKEVLLISVLLVCRSVACEGPVSRENYLSGPCGRAKQSPLLDVYVEPSILNGPNEH